MFATPQLIAYSDLGLFLAVIGVYVFFSALWLIYTLGERNLRRGAEGADESTQHRIDQLRIETMREISQSNKVRNNFAARVAAASKNYATRDEIAQLRSEMATVREIAVLSGKRVRELQSENKELRETIEQIAVSYGEHIAEYHSPEEVEVVASTTLKIFEPEATEPEAVEQEEATQYDESRGLIYNERPEGPDDLTRIWGVGAVNQDLLNEHGVYFFSQIAKWNSANIDKFNDILCFRGRIEREDWVGQAQRIVDGNVKRAA